MHLKASKRLAAKIEGHNNPRALSGMSQFLAAGMGGVISQYVTPTYLNVPDRTIDCASTH